MRRLASELEALQENAAAFGLQRTGLAGRYLGLGWFLLEKRVLMLEGAKIFPDAVPGDSVESLETSMIYHNLFL